jgi:hypothetical protein
VRAIGELDHDHADVADHCQQHLAEALGLGLGPAAELDLVELADAVDEFRHFAAKPRRDLFLRVRRVLHDVVEDRGDQCLRVEPEVGQEVCDRDGMRDVRLARTATLAVVRLEREVVGFLHASTCSGGR